MVLFYGYRCTGLGRWCNYYSFVGTGSVMTGPKKGADGVCCI